MGRRARVGSVRWARVYDVPYMNVRMCLYIYDGEPGMMFKGGESRLKWAGDIV